MAGDNDRGSQAAAGAQGGGHVQRPYAHEIVQLDMDKLYTARMKFRCSVQVYSSLHFTEADSDSKHEC
mgnify:CR=1 FL=1